ncbi:hypothetical protein P7K49_031191 [Saguinus oedipus]|uniref:Uncharacterized protein n=1 Tax=Saguinus oedipus TaxID=9490 RepID=A0ABQ9U4A8_SAGOE|nr:hypothetical protein P7K49_031191 [Saguinus oedipus]
MASPVLSLAAYDSHLEKRKLIRSLERTVLVISNSDCHILHIRGPGKGCGRSSGVDGKPIPSIIAHKIHMIPLLEGAAFWNQEPTGLNNSTNTTGFTVV